MAAVLWWLLVALLFVAGLAGTVLPALPGTLLVFAGVVLGAWIDDFTRIGSVTLAIEGVLAVVSLLLDYVAGVLGARRAGASRQALVGAALGTVLGVFAGVVGVLFMPLIGAVLGELVARRGELQAGAHSMRVGVATWIGIMAGLLAKVVIAFIMIGIFVAALWL